MRAVEDGNWWFAGKRMLVEELLRQALGAGRLGRVLDVGCGTGATLAMLARLADPVGIDRAPAALRLAAERRVGHLCAADAERLAFADGVFAAVTALDVVEHLDHPVRALREMGRVCAPGGVVLVTVPAYSLLWSDHDVALEHRRRYTPRLLRQQMEAAGLEVVRLSHAYAAFFLPALVVRRLLRLGSRRKVPEADLGMVAGPVNALLAVYMRCEAVVLPWLNLPFGTSLVCAARSRNLKSEI
ncbi:MAG: class I SAM-dependent methyltransferase [Armatimonadetes bacterium]|nr:class I SAM-dependent methyltransferase [Armatimonadota bacterium]